MIRYQCFEFAAVPRTGSTWFQHAVESVGLETIDGNTFAVHSPFPTDRSNLFRVTIVRHPYEWLDSYYFALQGGYVGECDAVNVFSEYAKAAGSFARFVESVLTHVTGGVGRMFESYQADNVLRVEDFPWSMIQFLKPFVDLTEKQKQTIEKLPRYNARKIKSPVNRELKKQVCRVERAFCDKYDYYQF